MLKKNLLVNFFCQISLKAFLANIQNSSLSCLKSRRVYFCGLWQIQSCQKTWWHQFYLSYNISTTIIHKQCWSLALLTAKVHKDWEQTCYRSTSVLSHRHLQHLVLIYWTVKSQKMKTIEGHYQSSFFFSSCVLFTSSSTFWTLSLVPTS